METKHIVRKTLLIASLLLLSPVGHSLQDLASRPEGPKTELISTQCWFEIGDEWPATSCFFMQVPENHSSTTGNYIRFPVVLFESPSRDEEKYPVLHLGGGGPGSPAGLADSASVEYNWNNYSELSLNLGRDLYIIDPRGVGVSEPRLNCTEFLAFNLEAVTQKIDDDTYDEKLLQAERACKARLNGLGVNVAQYNSLSVARDMELLRKALGIKQWNLYGVSYASRYALTIAREFPDTVRAMVLDGTVFPHVDYSSKYPLDEMAAFKRLFDYCESYKPCSYEHGDLGARYRELVEKLNKEPLQVTLEDVEGYGDIEMYLTGDDLGSVVYTGLYGVGIYDEFPDIVAQLEKRNAESIKTRLEGWVNYLLDSNHGDASAIAHFCHEELPFIQQDPNLTKVALSTEQRENHKQSLEDAKKECEIWGVQPAGEVENRPVVTSVPTLFLHGALDPVLPAADLKPQMKYFKNYAYLIFDELAHDVVSEDLCAEETAGAFFDHLLDYNYEVRCLWQ